MQRISQQTGIAAADNGQEKRLHLPEAFRKVGRKRSIILEKPPVAFLPCFGSLALKLFAKVFTNERMSIETPRIMRIFSREESRSS
jgi:hypothetical protein